MKTYSAIIILIIFCGISYAQNIEHTRDTQKNNINDQQSQNTENKINVETKAQNELHDIKLTFCNNTNDITTNTLSLQMRPGQRKEICMVFSNNGNDVKNIAYGFSYGQKDTDGKVVCDSNMSDKNIFSKFISPSPTTGIIIPAHANIVIKVNYLATRDASGVVYGCASYMLNQKREIEPGKMFLIVFRKSNIINIAITGSVYKFGRWDDLKNDTIKNPFILKIIIGILCIWIIRTIINRKEGNKKELHGKKTKK